MAKKNENAESLSKPPHLAQYNNKARLWMWLGVISVTIIILGLWGWAWQIKLGNISWAASAENQLTNRAQTDWNQAFTAGEPVSASSSNENSAAIKSALQGIIAHFDTSSVITDTSTSTDVATKSESLPPSQPRRY